MPSFSQNLAVLIAIDDYDPAAGVLRTPVADAVALGRLLSVRYGYEVSTRFDSQADLRSLRGLFENELPQQLDGDSRLLVYFAGHGGLGRQDDPLGPEGFLLPSDGRPEEPESHWPMAELHQALSALPCRHLLVLLDCCFAGAFQWSPTRHLELPPAPLFRERCEYFESQRARQVIASTAARERALDRPFAARDSASAHHSPFALALLEGLGGAADPRGDGEPSTVILVSELFAYLQSQLDAPQTPRTWPLKDHGSGEFLFAHADSVGRLPRADEILALGLDSDPYQGLEPFGRRRVELFFGREKEADRLVERILEQGLTGLVGPSGSGKSSLIRAGILPRLEDRPGVSILPPIRPVDSAWLRQIEDFVTARSREPGSGNGVKAIVRALESRPDERWILVLDPLEEALDAERPETRFALEWLCELLEAEPPRLHVLTAVRADFEPLVIDSRIGPHWPASRILLRPPSRSELRQIIERPAALRGVFFEDPQVVETLLDEIALLPGGLPLLSFTLSEMFRALVRSGRGDRLLTEADYRTIGGLAGSLRQRLEQEFLALDREGQELLRSLSLRWTEARSAEPVRRRVALHWLSFGETLGAEALIDRLVRARLLVTGRDGDGEAWVEPVHDSVVTSWGRLRGWLRHRDAQLWRQLEEASLEWQQSGRPERLLWHRDPRLDLVPGRTGEWPLPTLHELAFLEQSRSVRDRLARRRRRSLVAAFSFLVAIALALVWLRSEALRQRDTALVRQWLNQALEVREIHHRDELATQLVAHAAEVDRRQSLGLTAEIESASSEIHGTPFYSRILPTPNWPLDLAFSQSGRELFVGTRENFDRGVSRAPLEVHDLVAGGPPRRLDSRWTDALAVGPEGRFAWGAGWGTVDRWDLSSGRARTVQIVEVPDDLRFGGLPRRPCVAIDGLHRKVAWCTYTGEIRSVPLDAPEGAPDLRLGHRAPVRALHFDPEGWLVSGDQVGRVLLWPPGAEEPWEMKAHDAPVLVVRFDSRTDGRRRFLATADDVGVLRLSELGAADPSGRRAIIRSAEIQVSPGEALEGVDFHPKRRWLATGGNDQVVRLWDPEALLADPRTPPIELRGHGRPIEALAFSPTGDLLVTASFDHQVRLWELGGLGSTPRVLRESATPVTRMKLDASRGVVFVAATGGSIEVTEFPSGPTRTQWSAHLGETSALDWSPARGLLASGGYGQKVRLWKLGDEPESAEQPELAASWHPEECYKIRDLRFFLEGRRLAVACESGFLLDYDLEVIEAPLFSRRHRISLRAEILRALAWDPKRNRLAAGSGSGYIRFFAGAPLRPEVGALQHGYVRQSKYRVYALAFHPDGSLVSAAFDGTLRWWRDPDEDPIYLEGPTQEVRALDFTADGKWLAAASDDAAIYLFDLEKPAAAPRVLRHHQLEVTALVIDPEGRYLVSGDDTGQVLWIPLDAEAALDDACARIRHGWEAEDLALLGPTAADLPTEAPCRKRLR